MSTSPKIGCLEIGTKRWEKKKRRMAKQAIKEEERWDGNFSQLTLSSKSSRNRDCKYTVAPITQSWDDNSPEAA
jgi:hypothetical protein